MFSCILDEDREVAVTIFCILMVLAIASYQNKPLGQAAPKEDSKANFNNCRLDDCCQKDRCFILPQINLASGAAFALECPEISDRMTIGDRTLAAIAFVGLRKWFHRNIWIKHGRRKEKSFDVSSFLAHPTTCQDTCSDKLRKKRKFIRVGGLSKHTIIIIIYSWLPENVEKDSIYRKGWFFTQFLCMIITWNEFECRTIRISSFWNDEIKSRN